MEFQNKPLFYVYTLPIYPVPHFHASVFKSRHICNHDKKRKHVLYRENPTSRRLWPADLAELRLPAHDLGTNSSRGAGASSQRLLLCQAHLCWLAGCLQLRRSRPLFNNTKQKPYSERDSILSKCCSCSDRLGGAAALSASTDPYTLNSITLPGCQSGGPSLRR